jgi:hypothetical protein
MRMAHSFIFLSDIIVLEKHLYFCVLIQIHTGNDGGNGGQLGAHLSYLLGCGFRPESTRPSQPEEVFQWLEHDCYLVPLSGDD